MDPALPEWQRLVEGLGPPRVPSYVRQSWYRSLAARVNPVPDRLPLRRVPDDDLRRRLDANRELVALARTYLDRATAALGELPHVLVLVDHEGTLLLTRGGEPDKLRRLGLLPGFDWSERIMGTNAAGTALVENQPVRVAGAEHYNRLLHGYAGTAAPVHAADGSVIGAVGLGVEATQMSPLALALASVIGHAVDRGLARPAPAPPAPQRAALFSRAARVLVASLEYETMLEEVAGLGVPDVADCCFLDVLDETGSLRRTVVARSDAVEAELARSLRRFPPDPTRATPTTEALRKGKAVVVPDVTEEHLRACARDEEHLGLIRQLNPRSFMVVPLIARGQTLGALAFLSTESGRRYDAENLALAEEIAAAVALAVDNARLYREVREADRRKDLFVATVAHELRNPLGPILNALQVLERLEGTGPEVERMRAIIDRQTRRVVRLVDDLLDFARTKTGKLVLDRQPLDLREVVQQAVESLREAGRTERHTVACAAGPVPLMVAGDRTRLHQVVVNLLDNALKYTPPGRRVEVEVGREGDEAVLRVRDQGIGIPPELLPRIFELFVQAEPRPDRTRGGLGIGLTLVRSIVELHGGRVSAGSPGVDRGSEFVVRLPLLAGAPRPLGASVPRASAVVLVEDDPDAQEALRLLLELEGHRVTVAADGRDGLAQILRVRPDIALIDLGLPGADGYQVARLVRAAVGDDAPYLVALTGAGPEPPGPDDPFDAYLPKPVEPDALSRLVPRQLRF